MTDETQELLERVRTGDAAALEQLLQRHLPGLKRYVEMKAGAVVLIRESVDDLVQSACREVLMTLEDFDHEGSDERGFANWLYWNALRKILERNRFHTREKRDVLREVHFDSKGEEEAKWRQLYRTTLSPSEGMVGEENLEILRLSLDELPGDHATVIRLAFFQGLPRSEIAEILGRPNANAVQNLLSRALARLAVLIERKHREG